MTEFCKHYLPWTIVASAFSQEEINDACVNEEKRTIKRCPYRMNKETCEEFEPIEDNPKLVSK